MLYLHLYLNTLRTGDADLRFLHYNCARTGDADLRF